MVSRQDCQASNKTRRLCDIQEQSKRTLHYIDLAPLPLFNNVILVRPYWALL